MTMPASLRRAASVANSSPASARVPPSPVDDQHLPGLRLLKCLDNRQEVVPAAHGAGAADHLPEGGHGPQAGIHDPDVLVRVAQRRGVERGNSVEKI
jgi:hypothetical protein